MRSETAYEVYSYGDRRWMMEARFAAEAKNDAYVLANELRRQPGIEIVRVVREIWDPRTNGFSEVTIYEVRGVHANRSGGPRPVFGAMTRPSGQSRPSGQTGAAPRADQTGRVVTKLLMIGLVALLAAGAVVMVAQSSGSLSPNARVGLFIASLAGVLALGLGLGMSRADWHALLDDVPAQRGGASHAGAAVPEPPPLSGPGGPPPMPDADPAGEPGADPGNWPGDMPGGPGRHPAEIAPPPVGEAPSPFLDDHRLRAEVRLLDFLQRSLGDARLTREDRSSFSAFVFTIGAVDALARDAGLDRAARLAMIETCGMALGVDAATVTHTLENLTRVVSRPDGFALAQAGMNAMIDRLEEQPFEHALADALAAQRHAMAESPDDGITAAIELAGLGGQTMADTRKRITDMAAYHRGRGVTFAGDSVSIRFDRHSEALVACMALAAVIQPMGAVRPRFGLGDTARGAATALAASDPGEIVADVAFDDAIRTSLGDELPPGYRSLISPAATSAAAPPPPPAASAGTTEPRKPGRKPGRALGRAIG